ncbi:MAG: hypothetical protein DRI48_10860, partial [Chloroflexi bacterium]
EEGDGWVSGVIYDSSTCDAHLVECRGLAGATVTLARLENGSPSAVSGTTVTGPDGFFAFPADRTGRYALRVEKEGYTYGQRVVEIVRERSAPVNEIYLTPIDPAVTLCDENGCSHTSADGQMQVEVPAGAIQSGKTVTVTATEFDRVNFLPSGELPPGTWETYAFDLGGSTSVTFTQPVTVRIKNSRHFSPGVEIPLGFWNDSTMAWEHAGTAVVDSTGTWLVMTVTHFSPYDPNAPVSKPNASLNVTDQTGADGTKCAKGPCSSEIVARSGILRQRVELPEVQVLDVPRATSFVYDSGRADPSKLIEADLDLTLEQGITVGNYIQAELYIEGGKTAQYTFDAADLAQGGTIGRLRFRWDGRDAQGNRLPPGIYRYALRVRIPYRTQYYASATGRFGGPPDYSQPLGVWTEATMDEWLYGSVTLDADPGGPLGMGWSLVGQQRLYEDEIGRILIDDGDNGLAEFYFSGKDLLSWEETQGNESAVHEVARLHGVDGRENGGLRSGKPVSDAPTSGDQTNDAEVVILPATDKQRGWRGLTTVYHETLYNLTGGEASFTLTVTGNVWTTTLSLANTGILSNNAYVDFTVTVLVPEVTQQDEDVVTVQAVSADGLYTATAVLTTTTQPLEVIHVSSNISADTTWRTGNTYILDNDIAVESGRTLDIEPGVEVKGCSHCFLDVLGSLHAVGTSNQPIFFTSVADSGPGQWGGLRFDGDGGQEGYGDLWYVTLRYGEDNITLWDDCDVTIWHSEIYSSSHVGIYAHAFDFTSLYMSHVHLSDGGDEGIAADHSSISIRDSVINGFGAAGIGAGDGTDISLTRVVVANNAGGGIVNYSSDGILSTSWGSIYDNGGYGILNYTTNQIDARYTWWGDPSGPGGVGPGRGDEVS